MNKIIEQKKVGSSLTWRSSDRQITADGNSYTATPSEANGVMLRYEETADITMTAQAKKRGQGATTVNSDSAAITSPLVLLCRWIFQCSLLR